MNGEAGKGSQYRPQTRQEKRNFDRGYLRVYGIKCPDCNFGSKGDGVLCPTCDGLGYIPKPKKPSL